MWLHHYHDSSTQSTLSSFCGQYKMQGGRLSFHPSFYYLFIYFFAWLFFQEKEVENWWNKIKQGMALVDFILHGWLQK